MSEFQFKVWDRVYACSSHGGGAEYEPAEVVEIRSTGNYIVKFACGDHTNRHPSHVRRQTFKPGDWVRVVGNRLGNSHPYGYTGKVEEATEEGNYVIPGVVAEIVSPEDLKPATVPETSDFKPVDGSETLDDHLPFYVKVEDADQSRQLQEAWFACGRKWRDGDTEVDIKKSDPILKFKTIGLGRHHNTNRVNYPAKPFPDALALLKRYAIEKPVTAQKDCKPENSPEALSIPRDGKLPPCAIEVADEHQAVYLEKDVARRGHRHFGTQTYCTDLRHMKVYRDGDWAWRSADCTTDYESIPFSIVCPDYREPGEGKPELDTCTTYQVSFDADEFSCEPTPTFRPGDVIGPVTNKRDARRLEKALKEAGHDKYYSRDRWGLLPRETNCRIRNHGDFIWTSLPPTKSLSDVLPKENDMFETTTPNLATKIGNGAGWLTSKLVTLTLRYPGSLLRRVLVTTAYSVAGVGSGIYLLGYAPWEAGLRVGSAIGGFFRDLSVSGWQFAADGVQLIQTLIG